MPKSDAIFALVVGLPRQKVEIERHCFGDCNKILMGILMDDQLGGMAPCREEECPYEEGRVERGTIPPDDEVVYIRKLKEAQE